MTSVETVLRAYVAILPMNDVQLLAWVLIGTGIYSVVYLLFRFFFRISRTRTDVHFPRTLIGANIAGIMLSYTLILLGGVFDKKVLDNVVAQPAGRTILLLYSMVVVVIAFTGLFAGYSRVFKISSSNEKEESEENERRSDRQRNRTVGYIIAAAILGMTASAVNIFAGIFQIISNLNN